MRKLLCFSVSLIAVLGALTLAGCGNKTDDTAASPDAAASPAAGAPAGTAASPAAGGAATTPGVPAGGGKKGGPAMITP